MVSSTIAAVQVGINLSRRCNLDFPADTVFKPRIAVIFIKYQTSFIVTKMHLAITTKFMIPVSLDKELCLMTLVANTQASPTYGAAYIIFLNMDTVFHRPVSPAEPSQGKLSLWFNEPATAKVFLPAVFGS